MMENDATLTGPIAEVAGNVQNVELSIKIERLFFSLE